MENTILTTVPFSGFYNAHETELDNVWGNDVTNFAESAGFDIPESLCDLQRDCLDWGEFTLEYSREYVASFMEWLSLDGEFESMSSPKFYNFETDRIFAKISRDDLARLWKGVNRADLVARIKQRFTSRDGFISHYSNDLDSWGRLSTWDHNQVGTLLDVYVEMEHGDTFGFYDELMLMEDSFCNGFIDQHAYGNEKNAARFWKLWNYLTYDRPRRAIKTMAQWHAARRAENRPFDATPLGAWVS